MGILEKIKNRTKTKTVPENECFNKWAHLVSERLDKMQLVKDLDELEKFHQLKFKFNEPTGEDKTAFFFLSLEIDIFNETESEEPAEIFFRETSLWNYLGNGLEIPGSCFFKCSQIKTLLRESFYARFAKELLLWLEDESNYQNEKFVRQVPKIVSFIFEFGRKSSNEEELNFSREDYDSALGRIGIDAAKIKEILRKTRKNRFRMLALGTFRQLREKPPRGENFRTLNDKCLLSLMDYLKKGGLALKDLGKGIDREFVRLYFKPRGELTSIMIWHNARRHSNVE